MPLNMSETCYERSGIKEKTEMTKESGWRWIRRVALRSGVKVRTGETGREYLARVSQSAADLPEIYMGAHADDAMADFVERVAEWRRNLMISMAMLLIGIGQFPVMRAAGGTTDLGQAMMILCLVIAVVAMAGNLFCRSVLASVEEQPRYV